MSCRRIAIAACLFVTLTGAAPSHPREHGFHYVQDCARGKNWVRVEKSGALKKMYKLVSEATGRQWLPVYSCIRDQDKQDEILRANKCAPRFGDIPCSGRIAANISEHTRGVAGDFFLRHTGASKEDLCRMLSQIRARANGGRGGITYYGTDLMKDPDTGERVRLSALHIDVGTDGGDPSNPAYGDWCNWGACEKVLGEGHCKRTKFRLKRAEIEEEIAKAKLGQSQGSIAGLNKALRMLTQDCKPGDTRCRDNFK